MPNPLTLSVMAEAISETCATFGQSGNLRTHRPAPDLAEAMTRALLTTIEKAGYKVVPVEATDEMLRNGAASQNDFTSKPGPYPRTQAVWSAMLSSSPKIGEG